MEGGPVSDLVVEGAVVRVWVEEETRDVSRVLLEHVGGDESGLRGLCAIGSAMLVVRLLRLGVSARMVEGFGGGEGHCWVMVGDLVADPTIGQFRSWGGGAWMVGGLVEGVHIWEEVRVWDAEGEEEWPEEQRPSGSDLLSDEDRDILGFVW